MDEMTEWLVRMDRVFKANGAIRHQDANIELESFFAGLLRVVLDWELENENFMSATNQDSFDLADRGRRIAVQVTSTMGAVKIRKTLGTFIPIHVTLFDRLVFVYPFMEKSGCKADFSEQLNGFNFDPERDRLDLGDLLRTTQGKCVEKQQHVLNLLREELKPLGVALRMGVDRNVETIISIIRYISENPPAPIAPEVSPDGRRKLRRFQDYAEFLTRQYTINAEYYMIVEEARNAVGRDNPRVTRTAAWLKERSLAALGRYSDNAEAAFDAMVEELAEHERTAGRDFEEQAIRYFLADEFTRCNVFPNPISESE